MRLQEEKRRQWDWATPTRDETRRRTAHASVSAEGKRAGERR